jgi:hypothetical protein
MGMPTMQPGSTRCSCCDRDDCPLTMVAWKREVPGYPSNAIVVRWLLCWECLATYQRVVGTGPRLLHEVSHC